jgi:hypothetical protein
MELKKAILVAFKSCLWIFSIVLIACSSSHQTVTPEDRIVLSEGILDRGFWKSGDIFLEYQYDTSPDATKLSIQGSAKVKLMDEFKVWVLFLDADGKILERKLVYASGYRSNSSIGRQYYRSFENTFEMPSETTYMAFRSFVRPRVGRDP